MDELPNRKKLVADPQPRRGSNKGVLLAAAALLFAFLALILFGFFQ